MDANLNGRPDDAAVDGLPDEATLTRLASEFFAAWPGQDVSLDGLPGAAVPPAPQAAIGPPGATGLPAAGRPRRRPRY
jgi:cysteine desulfurase / selenocysteine lyase